MLLLAARLRSGTPERRQLLEALRATEPLDALERVLELPPGFVDVAQFAVDRGLTGGEMAALVELLWITRIPRDKYRNEHCRLSRICERWRRRFE